MNTSLYPTLLPMFDVLQDGRILVRPYREDDAQQLFDAIQESRQHLRPWLRFAEEHLVVEETRDWINLKRADWIRRESFTMSIWSYDRRFLGGISLRPRKWDVGYFEIGYWLRVSAEGHGYLTAAAQLVVDYAFSSLKAQRLEIRCDEKNSRSAAVARRLGFLQDGCLRHDSLSIDGVLRNTLIFSLLPEDRS